MDLLNQFEAKLEVSQMKGQLRLLNFACAAKARTRSVTLTRPSRDEILEFRLVGGHHKATAGGGIFVDFVGKGSSAAKKGLKRGDQILDVNGQNFAQVGSNCLVRIRWTFWFDARSMIIENNLRWCFFLFLVPARGSNHARPFPNPFTNPARQS